MKYDIKNAIEIYLEEIKVAEFVNNTECAKFLNAINTIDEACECLFQCQVFLSSLPIEIFTNIPDEKFIDFMKKMSAIIWEAQSGGKNGD